MRNEINTNANKLNTIKILIAVMAPVFFANCGQNPMGAADQEPAQSEASGIVHSSILLGKVGALSKTSAINLQKLILTAVSSATPADTVRDTASVSGNAAVTVLRTLTLGHQRQDPGRQRFGDPFRRHSLFFREALGHDGREPQSGLKILDVPGQLQQPAG
jgi:hypothetical protein